MGVKQCQFAYDDELHARKVALGKKITFKMILAKGIEAFEKEQNGDPEEDLFEVNVTALEIDILTDSKWVPVKDGDDVVDKTVRFRNEDGRVMQIRNSKRFTVRKVIRLENDDVCFVMKEAEIEPVSV